MFNPASFPSLGRRLQYIGLSRWLSSKESSCNVGDAGDGGLILGYRGGNGNPLQYSWASLVAQLVKNPPAMWETWVQSLGWEDPWRREWLPTPVFGPREFHGLYSPWGCKELGTTEQLSLFSTKFYNF